ncbi:thiopurine S-methyltransferase [Shewanella sp. 202IG2-18]|uniref:thiopurine S-methyltransferase n=1 Tax=Parashewanella hymeniacidonis TaxID=2807618 RepID=UPI0019616D8F|nr:thiopurine S-methyltransferase [Parashewanella hymeniacidonis]MBM7073819.1 thiopurine S-methyltransferase [Parashewanella hymeniacidonis]
MRTHWHDRWEQGRIKFHKPDFNPNLVEYWTTLCPNSEASTFVPLCGKSLDLLYLAQQGHNVIGCELVELGIKAFFEENQLSPQITQIDELNRWQALSFTIYQGDYFKIPAANINAEYLYDRAALIALPKDIRAQYVANLTKVAPNLKAGLLITLEYDQAQYDGPPFSVPQSEVFELFGAEFDVVELARHVTTDKPPVMRENDVELVEVVYKLERKG